MFIVAAMMTISLTTLVFCALLALLMVLALAGVRYIPSNSVGLVEKRFSRFGSVREGVIAMHREAGFQPSVLRAGLHYLTPLQFRVHRMPLVTIPQHRIGYVFARDGRPLDATQTLGANVEASDFEDAAGFLGAGGQRGPQRKVLREGTYAINLAQFVVITDQKLYFLPLQADDRAMFTRTAQLIASRGGFEPLTIQGSDDMLGIATIHDGPALPPEELIAPIVGQDPDVPAHDHNSFQDPERFIAAGGRRGRQLQVLVEGTYFLNRLFATVELLPKTVVEVGQVGVVVSYTGEHGSDLSGTEYKHGELVRRGLRGVWSEPLLPGKYAFNTYAGRIIHVPTTNFVLKWIGAEAGNHKLDENLREVSLITKDAFEPSLPLAVVVHIDYRKAPLVVQRFGNVKRLVEQTLDPMIAAYFKNIGQTRTLIQLLQDRAMIQKLAAEEMQAKFAHYNLELEEVLIGTPMASSGDRRIEDILTQLRTRQIAEEQVETYGRQERAAIKERELREAEAKSRQQQALTESELAVAIQTNQGKADYQRALQQAAQVKAMAEAEGCKMRTIADAEAARIRALGEAEADRLQRAGQAQAAATEAQVRAYGGPRLQLTQNVLSRFAQAIETAKIDLVPRVVVGGGAGGNGGASGVGGSGQNVMEALLTLLLTDRLGLDAMAEEDRDEEPYRVKPASERAAVGRN